VEELNLIARPRSGEDQPAKRRQADGAPDDVRAKRPLPGSTPPPTLPAGAVDAPTSGDAITASFAGTSPAKIASRSFSIGEASHAVQQRHIDKFTSTKSAGYETRRRRKCVVSQGNPLLSGDLSSQFYFATLRVMTPVRPDRRTIVIHEYPRDPSTLLLATGGAINRHVIAGPIYHVQWPGRSA
jgi:hypothetical protein